MAKYTLEQLEELTVRGFKAYDERIIALETCLENMRGSNFKIDYKAKLKASPELLQALKVSSEMCPPVVKTGKFTNKEGKEIIYAVFKDYQEATNSALQANKISINFVENNDTMELVTNVVLLSSNEIRSIKTQVTPSTNPDVAKAKFAGFIKAKGKMLANLLDLE